jgi:gamma-glutamylcyclotransferase (GGCT)/AIG2-like uncharacterized protein YtfP
MKKELLFVYGSLRRDSASEMYPKLINYCKYYKNGFFQGKLYNVDDYPGAVKSNSPGDKVYGELYILSSDDDVLKIFDYYEQCALRFPRPHEYQREKAENL